MPGWGDICGLSPADVEDEQGYNQSVARIQTIIAGEIEKGERAIFLRVFLLFLQNKEATCSIGLFDYCRQIVETEWMAIILPPPYTLALSQLHV